MPNGLDRHTQPMAAAPPSQLANLANRFPDPILVQIYRFLQCQTFLVVGGVDVPEVSAPQKLGQLHGLHSVGLVPVAGNQPVAARVAAYQATLEYYRRLAPMQEMMFKVMQRELNDMDESDRWKIQEDDEDLDADGKDVDRGPAL
jgi:hypothetical protein